MKKIAPGICLLVLLLVSCKKDHHPTTATGSLLTSDGSCRQATINGPYFIGTAAADTNYVQISVQITRPGSYHITTDRQNGVLFQASGTFADTGLNTVRLHADGSFTNTGQTGFTVNFDTSFCGFSVKVWDSAGVSMADNSWRFTAAGHTYSGPGMGTYYAAPSFMGDGFEFLGSMQGYTDTSLKIDFSWYVGIDSTGAHATPLGNTYFHFTTAKNDSSPSLRLDAAPQTAGAALYIRQQRWAIGVWTFSGTALDGNNNIIPITDGVFKCNHYNYASSQ